MTPGAQRPGHRWDRRGRRPSLVRILDRLASELHLDKAQVDQIRQVSTRTRATLKALDARIRRARHELRGVLEDVGASETRVSALVDRLNRLQSSRYKIVLLAPWKIRALLRPAQLTRLRALTGRPDPRR